MLNQEVVFNILALLDTMDLGINYIEERLEKLDIESTTGVLVDTIDSFAAVEEAITPRIKELEKNEIIEKTEKLKEKFNILVKEYEKNKGQKFTEIVQLSLKPAFKEWKEEIELRIRPYIAS